MQRDIETKFTRLLYLLNGMDKGMINLQAEGGKLNVTVRTLQRDIRTLQSAGFPIYDKRPGMYTFTEGFSLERMKLSAEEASLLCVMDGIATSLGGNFAKTVARLKGRFVTNGKNPFFIKLEQTTASVSPEIMQTLERAISELQIVNIYYSGKNPGYCNRLKPLKLCQFDGFWYLIALPEKDGFCFKFRLDKIGRVFLQETHFNSPVNIDELLAESQNIWFGLKGDVEVRLEIAGPVAEYFRKREYFPCQKIEKENKDGSIQVSCQVSNFMEVLPQIKSWLPSVRVIKPQTLAKELTAQLDEYLKKIRSVA